MRIYFNDLELTGSDIREQVDSYRVETTTDVQITRIFRAAFPKIFNRGNSVTSISFSVSKLHSTEAEAFKFVTFRGQNLAATEPVGTAKFATKANGKTITITFANAALETVGNSEIQGISTVTNYRLILGEAS